MKISQHLSIIGCNRLMTTEKCNLVQTTKIEVTLSFIGFEGVIYVDEHDLQFKKPSYDYIEIESEVYDSFEAQLQNDETWEDIKTYINEHIEA
jgi:hypothetical protein